MERDVFMKISAKIQALPSAIEIIACFEALCGARRMRMLLEILPGICSDAEVDYKLSILSCDWSKAKNWAQWWCRSTHLRMLCKAFTKMDNQTWKECPTTTNAVERRNQDCSVSKPLHPKLAMMEAYKLDKVACCKYIAANEGISISYRSKTDEARRCSAAARRLQRKRKSLQDTTNQFGPPDKWCHFEHQQIKNTDKTTIKINVSIHSNTHPELIGKRVQVKYDENGSFQWYKGVITSFNSMTGKYVVFFPSDKTTEEFCLDEDGFMVID